MVKFYNKYTGSAMFVADERMEEYKAAGHKLAADSEVQSQTKEPKKRATKKTATK